MYLTKKEKDMDRLAAKDIADNSKIFGNNFNVIKKIDEYVMQSQNLQPSNKINFPKIMNQVKRQYRNSYSHSNHY